MLAVFCFTCLLPAGPGPGPGGAAAQSLPPGVTSLLFPDSGWTAPPILTWLSPPKGHIKGGTLLTILGAGFKQSPFLSIRFASDNEFEVVPARYVSASEITCVTPARSMPQTVQVTASNDGAAYSGFPLVYAQGAGTFLFFLYDNSEAGCQQCVNSDPWSYSGLNPNFIGELWRADNASGPYVGGTLVTITAVGLRWPASGPYDMLMQDGVQTYNGPVGGPGTPNPFNQDPNSAGNGPPITATFYPGEFLKCMVRGWGASGLPASLPPSRRAASLPPASFPLTPLSTG